MRPHRTFTTARNPKDDRLTDTPVKLDGPDVVVGIGVTHLTYRVSRT